VRRPDSTPTSRNFPCSHGDRKPMRPRRGKVQPARSAHSPGLMIRFQQPVFNQLERFGIA